jgi:DNA-binding MarR family transcriptional regulator
MDARRIIHLLSRTRDRIQKHFQREIDALELGNIAPAHGSVFYALQAGPQAMQDLARLIERDNSTVTALADKLEKLGYVKRSVSEHDTRSNILRLTDKGIKAAPRIIAASQKIVGQIFTGFSAAERDELVRLLGKVYTNMRN